MKPKAILFDYGDTLLRSISFKPIRGTAKVMKYCKNPKGITPEVVQKFADEVLKDIRSADKDYVIQLDSKAFSRLIYGKHGITFDITDDELDRIFLDAAEEVDLIDGVVDFLEFLEEENIRMAVLSNTAFSESSHRYQLRKYGIEEYFEFFMATSDYVIRKPDKRIFSIALNKFDLKADEVWYIGNMFEFDVRGAKNAGIYPVWLNENEEEALEDINHLNVDSYSMLIKTLKDIW